MKKVYELLKKADKPLIEFDKENEKEMIEEMAKIQCDSCKKYTGESEETDTMCIRKNILFLLVMKTIMVS